MAQHLHRFQRLTAALLVPLILGHVGFIGYAVIGGLDATDVATVTQDSIGWALYYGLFVVTVSIHAPIGLRNVVRTWTPWRGVVLDYAMIAIALALLVTGARAVAGIVAVELPIG